MTAPVSLAGWQPAADLLHERIILLTGAANGIGRALADAMARQNPAIRSAPPRVTFKNFRRRTSTVTISVSKPTDFTRSTNFRLSSLSDHI